MVKLIPFFLSLVLLAGCGAASGSGYLQISMDEAIRLMEQEVDYVVLDVRTPEEFREGHIPGAINIPNEDIGSDEISVLTDPEALILVYCRSGNRSKQSAEKLAALGDTNVAEF